ncbi:hypothetical protein DB30_01824 [Enhygromyxa salina]|uniref:RNA polymerase sigma-70 region 4 domain-containing protein n=1 Tax=Enhygromyxa salina TaxID=215803 RepID=A0A0C1ZMH5_9BACT|nr:sigma-70 family RNA polymerase sigma factor [Enhygromyxa salina]KIG12188.1 hypothetical protein DB30_01824 [Enhygromyxa salina]
MLYPTDADLLARIREGDHQAREIFAEKHADWARFYAEDQGAKSDADEIGQHVVMQMILRPPATLRGTTARPYMCQAIRRRVYRVRGRALIEAITCGSDLADRRTSPSDKLATLELLQQVWAAVEKLTTRERTVMRMRYGDDLPFGEIADAIGRREPTVRSIHARALRKLRDFF